MTMLPQSAEARRCRALQTAVTNEWRLASSTGLGLVVRRTPEARAARPQRTQRPTIHKVPKITIMNSKLLAEAKRMDLFDSLLQQWASCAANGMAHVQVA